MRKYLFLIACFFILVGCGNGLDNEIKTEGEEILNIIVRSHENEIPVFGEDEERIDSFFKSNPVNLPNRDAETVDERFDDPNKEFLYELYTLNSFNEDFVENGENEKYYDSTLKYIKERFDIEPSH